MTPIPLFKAPEGNAALTRQADILAQACSIEYRDITGKENTMPRHRDCPVVCVAVEAGYWQLECNDSETARDTLSEIAKRLRAWEHAPAMQQ